MTSRNHVLNIAAGVALTIGAVQHAAATTASISTVQVPAAKTLSDAALPPMGKLVIPVTYTEEFLQKLRAQLPKGDQFAGGTGRSEK